MEKTSKVKRVTFKTEWQKKENGVPTGNKVFYHDIELENGDSGSIGCKEMSPAKLNPGQELTYTIDGNKIKAVQAPNGFNGGFKAKAPANNASFCLAYSKDIFIAKLQSLGGKEVKEDEIFSLADKMYNWMEAHK